MKKLHARELSRNQSILRFDVILQHGGLPDIFLLLPRFPSSRKPAQNNNTINKLSQVEDEIAFQLQKVIQDIPSLLGGPPVASDFL